MQEKLKDFRSHGINHQPKAYRTRWHQRREARVGDVKMDIETEINELSDGRWLPLHHVDPNPKAHELIAAIVINHAVIKLVYDDGAFDIIRG